MKNLLLDILVCPSCLPEENKLKFEIFERQGEEIVSGVSQCTICNRRYPIKDGVISFLPVSLVKDKRVPSKYEKPSVVSSYLWSHYADLTGDMEAGTAYREWAELFDRSDGFCLDAGCAVGRFTFEMSTKSDFVVGVDNSLSFVLKARALMKKRQLTISLPEEGLLVKDMTICLPEKWQNNNIEFILGDAHYLPFRSNLFSTLASLNLVDKLRTPLMHLKEMNRVAKKRQAQFLFSDPFSWSSLITEEKNWLGGTNTGPYAGRGTDNIVSTLAGKKAESGPVWKIEKTGHVWWKIRNHKNHFELIRSCFLKAAR